MSVRALGAKSFVWWEGGPMTNSDWLNWVTDYSKNKVISTVRTSTSKWNVVYLFRQRFTLWYHKSMKLYNLSMVFITHEICSRTLLTIVTKHYLNVFLISFAKKRNVFINCPIPIYLLAPQISKSPLLFRSRSRLHLQHNTTTTLAASKSYCNLISY